MEASCARPFAELLAALAARTPAPGGASAAAWAGGLAAALVEMAARFADDEQTAARAAELRASLMAAGERDLSAYEPVLDASRLPPEDPSRPARIESALDAASEPPLSIARDAAEVAELGARAAGRSRAALAGDAAAGVLLAEAACQAAARIVEINLGEGREDLRAVQAGALADRAAVAREQVIEGA